MSSNTAQCAHCFESCPSRLAKISAEPAIDGTRQLALLLCLALLSYNFAIDHMATIESIRS
ncbi:MAG: hypothetical protein Q9212_000411 [Teloschistes hypoglaucus]